MTRPGTDDQRSAPDSPGVELTDWRPVGGPGNVRVPKSFADALPENYPLTKVTVGPGLRRKFKRTKIGRRSVTVWPAYSEDGVERYMVQFRAGGAQKHILLTADAIAALASLCEELRQPASWAFTVQIRRSEAESPAQVEGASSRDEPA